MECEKSIGQGNIKSKPNYCIYGDINEDEVWEILKMSYSNCILVIFDPRFKFGFVELHLNKAFGDIACVHID